MADRYASLKQGLVGCWIPSVSGSGLLLPDLSGRGNNGALTGMDASDWVSASYGRALDFDGSNDRVVASGNTSFTNGVVSVSGWMRRTGAAGQFNAVVFSKGTLEGNANSTCALYWNEMQGWSWFIVDTANNLTIIRSNTVTSQNQWVHVAGIASSAGLSLYLNGSLANSTTGANVKNSSHSSFIGGADTGGGAFASLLGQTDDIRAYNRILTEPEIRLLASEPGIGFKPAKKLSRFSQRFTYDPPKARSYGVTRVKETDYATLRQGLVGAWCPSLPNGGSGNTLSDQSGYNNHGSLVGMGPEDWVSGQYGRALDFDGVNDEVTTNAISSLNSANQFTITYWASKNSASSDMLVGSRMSSTNGAWLQWYSDGVVYFSVRNGQQNFIQHSLTYRSDFIHFAATYSNTSSAIYIDGKSVATGTNGTVSSTGFDDFGIGALSGGFFAAGKIDDIRLYNRALSESEIRLLASRPGIGLRQESHRQTFYQFLSGARRKRILTGLP